MELTSELAESPGMKRGVWAMLGMLGFLLAYLVAALGAIISPPVHAGEKPKERIKPAVVEPQLYDPDAHFKECIKKRKIDVCKMLVELRTQYELIKKQPASQTQ